MKTKKILVVAAHPDDEILGCGATIAKYAAAGHEVTVLIAAEGLMSRTTGANAEEVNDLHKICREANIQLGAKKVEFLRFPDNRMDSVDLLDVVKSMEECIARIQPEIILTHHHSDLNIDHRICHQAVLTAARPLPGSPVQKILFFEVPSATGWSFSGSGEKAFAPNYFVNVTATLPAKKKALSAYQQEMRPFPHARSLEACEHLARWRGSLVGVEAAEAFEVGRITEIKD